MTKHRNLADSELHTPKGTDSATDNQILYAIGGASSFTEFLEPCGDGYAATGVWDYSVDGYDSDGYITFTGLENYAYLELETHNIVTSFDDIGFLDVGTSGAWGPQSWYYTGFFDDQPGDVLNNQSYPIFVVDSDSTGVNFGVTRIYNFNKAAPTMCEVWSSNPGDSQHNMTVATERGTSICTRLRIIGLANVTGGKVYLRGIKG